jgi:predicted nucleic acid-binding protein
MAQAELFLDTAFAIALSSRSDDHHDRAVSLATEIEAAGTQLVTTRAVLLEIGNALSRTKHRPASIELLQSVETDPKVTIVPLSEDLFSRALKLYRERPDKEWGLVDCVSFVVMKDRGMTEARTPDDHFEQAGFQPLLRNS